MKVWLCSDGSYSDMHPTAVYSDEATALRVTAAYGWDNKPEEYDLDPEVPKEIRDGMTHFVVRMWENGDTDRTYISEPCEYNKNTRWEHAMSYNSSPVREGRMLITSCWAEDQTHAVKIANERRIMALASPVGVG